MHAGVTGYVAPDQLLQLLSSLTDGLPAPLTTRLRQVGNYYDHTRCFELSSHLSACSSIRLLFDNVSFSKPHAGMALDQELLLID